MRPDVEEMYDAVGALWLRLAFCYPAFGVVLFLLIECADAFELPLWIAIVGASPALAPWAIQAYRVHNAIKRVNQNTAALTGKFNGAGG